MAGLTGETIRIGGYEYQYSLLPTMQGHAFRWELIGLLGEHLLSALAGLITKGSVADVNVETFLAGLSGLFARLEPKFVWRLQSAFVDVTRYREIGAEDYQALGKAWQVHFAGKYHELDQLTWAQLRRNYLSFLDDSEGWQALQRAGSAVLSGGKFQTILSKTGKSGESSAATASAPV